MHNTADFFLTNKKTADAKPLSLCYCCMVLEHITTQVSTMACPNNNCGNNNNVARLIPLLLWFFLEVVYSMRRHAKQSVAVVQTDRTERYWPSEILGSRKVKTSSGGTTRQQGSTREHKADAHGTLPEHYTNKPQRLTPD